MRTHKPQAGFVSRQGAHAQATAALGLGLDYGLGLGLAMRLLLYFFLSLVIAAFTSAAILAALLSAPET